MNNARDATDSQLNSKIAHFWCWRQGALPPVAPVYPFFGVIYKKKLAIVF